VTAGGTREPIDPVRFIGNRSTGKMGVALAQAALDRGADVVLVAGPVEMALPEGPTLVRIESTAELRAALQRAMFDGSRRVDALVMAAAVADFSPTRPSPVKVHRGEGLTLQLESTPDLLAEVARTVRERPVDPAPILVGFAAETGSLHRAAEKLRAKGVDLLVANDVAEPGSGFGTDTNRVAILAAGGTREDLPLLSKREVADRILDRIAAAWDARDEAAQTAAEASTATPAHGSRQG
jgi:phosphopantothenoylcysteine decarboxylase/phosphopantothenate--cysteine ligase